MLWIKKNMYSYDEILNLFVLKNEVDMQNDVKKLGTVLIVDDMPDNIDLLIDILSDEFNVKVATNGLIALKIAESAQPDVILLDIMMPDMDGYEVCECLKRRLETRNIPVIFVTALNEISNEERGFEVGCVDYLTKPISPSLALARVRTHTALRKAQMELEEWNGNLKSRVLSIISTMREQIQKVNELQAEQSGGSINSMIIAMKGLLELIDFRNATHAESVSKLASEAARSMSLDNKIMRKVMLAGLLHDIGKLGLPDYDFSRSLSELTENEQKDYKRHPLRSQYLVSDNEELSDVSLMVRHHHEAYNGTGFPDGLSGEEIPLGARLLAIADFIEHAAASVKEDKADYALNKLSLVSGALFDPQLVSHFRWPTRALYFQGIRKSGGVTEVEVPLQELTPGMVVTRDLLTGSGIMLASQGTSLEIHTIALIRKYYLTDPPPHGIFVALQSAA